MRQNRISIVVVMLAVACCADRAVIAAPALPPQAAQLAQRVVSRLTTRFCRTVTALRWVPARAGVCVPPLPARFPVVVIATAKLPFAQLPLPPPAL